MCDYSHTSSVTFMAKIGLISIAMPLSLESKMTPKCLALDSYVLEGADVYIHT